MDERFQKTFRLMFSPVVTERAAAADALVSMAERAGLGASDLTLVQSNELQGKLYKDRLLLQGQVEVLSEKLAFLQARAPDKQLTLAEALAWMEGRKARQDRWPEVREMARRRLFKGQWPAESQAYQQIARAVGVTPDEVRAWRDGSAEVPEAVLDRLREVQPGDRRKALEKKVVKTERAAFAGIEVSSTDHAILSVLAAAGPRGKTTAEVAEASAILPKTVSGRLSDLKKSGLTENAGAPGYWRLTAKASGEPDKEVA